MRLHGLSIVQSRGSIVKKCVHGRGNQLLTTVNNLACSLVQVVPIYRACYFAGLRTEIGNVSWPDRSRELRKAFSQTIALSMPFVGLVHRLNWARLWVPLTPLVASF